jgi:hypothetical protein
VKTFFRFIKNSKSKCYKQIPELEYGPYFLYLSVLFGKHETKVINVTNEQSRETGNTGHTRRRKTKQKHSTICVGHHYSQTNIYNVNKS